MPWMLFTVMCTLHSILSGRKGSNYFATSRLHPLGQDTNQQYANFSLAASHPKDNQRKQDVTCMIWTRHLAVLHFIYCCWCWRYDHSKYPLFWILGVDIALSLSAPHDTGSTRTVGLQHLKGQISLRPIYIQPVCNRMRRTYNDLRLHVNPTTTSVHCYTSRPSENNRCYS